MQMSLQVWSAAKVRETFIKYFLDEHGHTLIPSSRVVPENDPTLLFTNAGMNQFKNMLLGKEDPNSKIFATKRAVNSQKCVRAGGKHNDLEDVGKDTYHHTFFEMLGSWSFGDYFKQEAISMAWELLTSRFGIRPDRLYVTVFGGDAKANLAEDSESQAIWEKYIPAERILKCGMKDNFWEMGDTGPCGRSTEIHYDMIGGRDASLLVNKDDPTVVELWNLVFVEYNRHEDGKLQPLPVKHVDTGMGLERLLAVLQNKKSNYDTDLWDPIFKRIQVITKSPTSYESEVMLAETSETASKRCIAYRVLADHIRTLTIAIVDGATPEATGRGYVLRRIVRRAIRYGHEFLQAPEGFLVELIDTVKESLGGFFSELCDEIKLQRVRALLSDEQKAFYKTYKLGLKHFENILANLSLSEKPSRNTISGSDAFILHDRYGFPVDLTIIMATENGVDVDVNGFEAEKIRSKSKNTDKSSVKKDFLDSYAIHHLQTSASRTTIDEAKYMVGENVTAVSQVLQIYSQEKRSFINGVSESDGTIGIILDITSFYAESGGQIYDTGKLVRTDGEATVFQVSEVFKFAGYICHIGRVIGGVFSVNDMVSGIVDCERRKNVCKNHTMTHILNHKLRDVLQYGHPEKCTEVNQKGSFVGDNLLRFDFSWNEKIEPSDIHLLESFLNEEIQKDVSVYSREVGLDEALNISSLRAIFDEKYGECVRVVSIGIPVETLLEDAKNFEKLNQYSIELCGGTHVKNTSDIGEAAILSEEALTKGVRRIMCVTGNEARRSISIGQNIEEQLDKLILGSKVDDDSFGTQLRTIEQRSKEISKLRADLNASASPLTLKLRLRPQIDEEIAKLLKDKKRITNDMIIMASERGKSYAESVSDSTRFILFSVTDDFGLNRDALLKIHSSIREVCKSLPLMALLYCSKTASGLVIASSPNENTLSSLEWVRHATGKGGGKANLSQGGFQGEIEDIRRKAKEFAAEKI